MVEKSENSTTMDDNENYLELSKMNFSPFHFHQANVNVNQFAKFAQNLPTPSQVLSIVSGSDGNVQFLQAQPQMTTPTTTINPTQTYITLPITIPPSKPGDATQTFQIQVLNPNPVPQPKFQIPLLQQHGTTVLTVAYSPQDGEILPNQMTEGGPVTVLAAIQPQDLQLLAQQNGLAAQQQLQQTLQQQVAAVAAQQQHQQQQQSQASDSDENNEKETRQTIKTEPSFWGQTPVTISTVPPHNTLTTDLSEFFHTRSINMQPYLKFNTEGINIKKELNYSDAVTQIQLTDNNNVLSINNNFNSSDNSNNNNNNNSSSSSNAVNSSIDDEQNPDVESTSQLENGDEEKIEVDANGKVKKKRKVKKKAPKPKRPKPGQVHIATAIDGTILFCCPECNMAYPEKESLEQHLAVHKIERRYICDICGAGLKRKEHLERHKLGHNPERPYVCQVCLKGFKRKEHLNLHVVIHSGLKTEICSECGKGFYRKDHLRKHIKSHQTKRAKEEANAAHIGHHSNTTESAGNSENVPTIKREVLSPNNSPNQPVSEDPPAVSTPVSLSQFSLPREVTIHVTSNNTTLPVQIQLPPLIQTSSNGEMIVKIPDS